MVVAERLQVLDPTVQAIPEDAVVARRPNTLDGKVIGLLANGKINSEEVLALTQEVLADRYEFKAVVARNKHGTHHALARSILSTSLWSSATW